MIRPTTGLSQKHLNGRRAGFFFPRSSDPSSGPGPVHGGTGHNDQDDQDEALNHIAFSALVADLYADHWQQHHLMTPGTRASYDARDEHLDDHNPDADDHDERDHR